MSSDPFARQKGHETFLTTEVPVGTQHAARLRRGLAGLLQKFQPNSTCGATRQLLQLTIQRFHSKTNQIHQCLKFILRILDRASS